VREPRWRVKHLLDRLRHNGYQRPEAMKKTVVLILSTNYAGSHYLSLMLGSHSRAMHIGEIHRVREGRTVSLDRVCWLCRDKGFCPIFSDIAPKDVDRVYDIIFSRIDPKVEVLIDNSKNARGWLERFLGNDTFQRKYIHLIRDPRALVRRWLLAPRVAKHECNRRWKMMRNFPGQALRFPFASREEVFTYQWLQQNRQITRWIEQNQLDAQVVTYRDLARNPAGEVRRLAEWMGLTFEPAQLEYWNFEHHGTQKPEYEWVKKEKPQQHFDLRWQTELPESVQQQVTNNPDVRAYLGQISVQMGNEGLTRGANEKVTH
jgi:hypothetical protein